MSERATECQGACYCGAIKVVVDGAPVAAGYCHCHSCRKWHAAPINAWAVWPKDRVTIDGAVTESNEHAASRRVACKVCGGCVANIKPKSDMVVVYAMTLAGSPFAFEPTLHLYYGERVMDIADDLPKFVDSPVAFGGSGALVDDAGRTGWCLPGT